MQQQEFAVSFPELREAFEAEAQEVKKPRLLLTAAVPVGPDNVRGGYDVPAVARSVCATLTCCGLRLRCACYRKVSSCSTLDLATWTLFMLDAIRAERIA
jgi:hypothetical protein